MATLTAEQKLTWTNQVVLKAIQKAGIACAITPTPNGMRLDLTFTDTDALAEHIKQVAQARAKLQSAYATQTT
jgi:hypothetical protein